MKIKTAKSLSEKALGLFTKAVAGLEEANELAIVEINEGFERITEYKVKISVFKTRNEQVAKTREENLVAIAAINTLLGKKED